MPSWVVPLGNLESRVDRLELPAPCSSRKEVVTSVAINPISGQLMTDYAWACLDG
jgi:hypothetical protein